MKRIEQYVPHGYRPKWWCPSTPKQVEIRAGGMGNTEAMVCSRSIVAGFDEHVRVYHPVEFYIVSANVDEEYRATVLDNIAVQLDRITDDLERRLAIPAEYQVMAITYRYSTNIGDSVTTHVPADLRVAHDRAVVGTYSVTGFDERDAMRFALQPDVVTDEHHVRALQEHRSFGRAG